MRVRLHYTDGAGKRRQVTGDAVYPPRVDHAFIVARPRGTTVITSAVTEVLPNGMFRTETGRGRVELLDAALLRIARKAGAA